MKDTTVIGAAGLTILLLCQTAHAEQKICADQEGVNSVIQEVNQLRSEKSLSKIAYSDLLSQVAAGHSRDMSTRNTLSHEGANGEHPSDRALAAGYEYRRIAENVAAGQKTPDTVMDGWRQSSSHLKNMLLPDLVDIGVACISDDDSAYGTWWTMMLGTPRDAEQSIKNNTTGVR